MRAGVRLLRLAAEVRQKANAKLLYQLGLPWAQCVTDILERHYPSDATTLDAIRVVKARWNDELPPPAGAGEPPWPEGKRRVDTPQWKRYLRDRTTLRERLLVEGVHPEDLGGLRV